MSNRDLMLMTSILALLRGEVTVRGVAERFGVTEAQVARWRDVFEIAGMLALASVLSGQSRGPRAQERPGGKAQRSDSSRKTFGDPTTTTTPHVDGTKKGYGDPTTTTTTTSYIGGTKECGGDPTTTTTPPPTTPAVQSGGKAKSKSKMGMRSKRTKSKNKR